MITFSNGTDRVSYISPRLQLSKSTVHSLLKSLNVRSSHTGHPDPSWLSGSSSFWICFPPACGALKSDNPCLWRDAAPKRFYRRDSHFAPLYTWAAGKVLLSQLNDKELQPLMKGLSCKPLGPYTITDSETLFRERPLTLSGGCFLHTWVIAKNLFNW